MKKNNTSPSHAVEMVCMNSNPETSKWWKYAPVGGCNEVVSVDSNTAAVLCWKCTMRSTSTYSNV